MPHSPVELKGSNFTLSVAYLNSVEPEIIYATLQEKVQKAPAFLRNAPIVFNVSTLPIDTEIDFPALKNAAIRAGLFVIGVTGCQTEQQKLLATKAKLPLLTEGKAKKSETPAMQQPKAVVTQSMIINTPVRTGQQIYARNCDLIVTSQVSAGAEIIADGNIHVYGLLRGRALAGASGDDKAQIFCTQLAAELVSITGQYWLSDNIPAEYYEKAAQLFIKDNQLTINVL